jgi:RNA polymerase sigma-70 factor (ECF subfamily)
MAFEPSDEALVARVAQKDVAAFATLYDRYARRVYAWSAHMVGSAEAEDVVQESFLRLWDKAGQFDARRGRFVSWFMAVARHQVIRQLRKRTTDQRVVAADEIERVLADAVAPERAPDEEASSREAAAAVLQALATLPTEQRRVLVLAYFAGFTQAAIAKITGAPLGTVKKRTRLALRKLRERLAEALGSSWTETG